MYVCIHMHTYKGSRPLGASVDTTEAAGRDEALLGPGTTTTTTTITTTTTTNNHNSDNR